MTRRRLLAQPWLNGSLAMLLFLAPAVLIGLLLGRPAFTGALAYLAALFLVGEVHVTWIPLRERFGRKDAIPSVRFPGEEEA